MVSPRPSRSSRPLAVRFSRLLPPRSSAAHADLHRVFAVVVTVICSVLGAGPAAAQPAIPVPRPDAAAVPVPPVPLPAIPPPAGPAPRTPPRRARAGDAAAPTAAPAPTDAAGAATQLQQVQRDAEALTEQWHAAQDDVTAREAEVGRPARRDRPGPGRRRRGPRRRGAATASRSTPSRSPRSRAATSTSSTRCSPAGSPQDFLDQMSALEMLAADHAAALDKLTSRRRPHPARPGRRRRGRGPGPDGGGRGRARRAGARRPQARRRPPHRRGRGPAAPAHARAAPSDRLGPDVAAPALPSGTGAGVRALRAAAGQLGKPYRWGAEGPAASTAPA